MKLKTNLRHQNTVLWLYTVKHGYKKQHLDLKKKSLYPIVWYNHVNLHITHSFGDLKQVLFIQVFLISKFILSMVFSSKEVTQVFLISKFALSKFNYGKNGIHWM